MLYDGINLIEGSSIENAAIATGTTFPTNPSSGELFYRSDEEIMYVYDGAEWDAVGSGTGFDATLNQTITGTWSFSNPLTGATPTTGLHLTTKSYVDNTVGSISSSNQTITGNWTFSNVVSGATPTTGVHLTTKSYVDNLVQGLSWKQAARAATTANITLSGPQTIDGVAVVAGNRVLVKNQTTSTQNGVYVVDTGAWTRTVDMDGSPDAGEVNGAAIYITDGTVNGDTAWSQTVTVTTVGVQAMAFVQIAGNAVPSDSPTFTTQMTLGATNGSSFLIRAVDTVSQTAGTLTIRGSSNSGTGSFSGGNVVINGGPSTNGGNPAGGSVQINGGTASQFSGSITLATPNSSITSGSISLTTGTAVTRGTITLAASSIILNGTLTPNGSTGTQGQVLTVNNSGLPVWQDAGTLNGASAGTLTGTTLATNVVSSSLTSVGTITSGTWSGSFGAVSGANLTNLNASNLSSGTVAIARIGTSGSPSTSTFLRGDGAWSTVSSLSVTATGTNNADIISGAMADSDLFRIRIGGTATNAGFAEIATADDGSEPIHVRQYTGSFSVLVRTLTLLDESGNTSVPGNLILSSATPSVRVQSNTTNKSSVLLQNSTSGTALTDGFELNLESTGVDVSFWNYETGYLRLATTNTERLRILSNGAWSVGSNGISTGTSGQVLTSTGGTTAPTWQTVSYTAEGLTGTTLAASVVNSSLTSVGTLASLNVTGNVTAATPTTSNHLTTKAYVDSLVQGLSWKSAVRAATTANITLSGTQTIDGIAVVAGERVLVKNQTTVRDNGIYVVAAGAWSRSTDFDSVSPVDEVNGAAVYVTDGTTNGDTIWTQTATVATVGVNSITFAQISSGSVNASSILGTTLAPNVVSSSLTSVGSLSSLSMAGALSFGTNYTETRVQPTLASTTTINCALGNVYVGTLSGSISSLTFSNVPSDGRVYTITLFLTQGGGGSSTIAWPNSVRWSADGEPTLSTTAGATDIITLMTHDGGSTWYGVKNGIGF